MTNQQRKDLEYLKEVLEICIDHNHWRLGSHYALRIYRLAEEIWTQS